MDGHMVPSLLHVRNVLTVSVDIAVYCEIWLHLFDVDSDFLPYPVPLSMVQFCPKCSQFICWCCLNKPRMTLNSLVLMCR